MPREKTENVNRITLKTQKKVSTKFKTNFYLMFISQ